MSSEVALGVLGEHGDGDAAVVRLDVTHDEGVAYTHTHTQRQVMSDVVI